MVGRQYLSECHRREPRLGNHMGRNAIYTDPHPLGCGVSQLDARHLLILHLNLLAVHLQRQAFGPGREFQLQLQVGQLLFHTAHAAVVGSDAPATRSACCACMS